MEGGRRKGGGVGSDRLGQKEGNWRRRRVVVVVVCVWWWWW